MHREAGRAQHTAHAGEDRSASAVPEAHFRGARLNVLPRLRAHAGSRYGGGDLLKRRRRRTLSDGHLAAQDVEGEPIGRFDKWIELASEDRDLVGATGLTISYPLKEKSVAMRLSDMGEPLIAQGEWGEKASEAFLVGARAQWSYASEEARLFDLMAEEVQDALEAMVEFENKLVFDKCVADVAAKNAFNAATAGSFGYADLIKMRKLVLGPMDYVVLHPSRMADVLSDDKFLRTDFITTIKSVEPSTTMFETKLGFTFIETEQATDNVVIAVNSRRAGRFTVKREVAQQPFDMGKSGAGALVKGVTLWELIDAVVVRGDSVAKCTV